MRKALLALLALFVPFLVVTATHANAATSCAWQYSSVLTNAAWPDSNAQYFITPFTVQANMNIVIHGTVPDARYYSFTAYNSMGVAGPANVINDTQIVPNADNTYTVHLTRASFPNTFNGTQGYLNYRVYVPVGNVPLPSLTVNGVNMAPCGSFAAPNFVGLFNNPDNSYVELYPAAPFFNSVTMISGKAPTAVRYWSWCSYAWSTAVVDCRYDANIRVVDGYYHIVLGNPSQKAAIEAAGGTYVQWAPMVMLRNLLGNQTTGEYAPTMSTTTVANLAQRIR